MTSGQSKVVAVDDLIPKALKALTRVQDGN